MGCFSNADTPAPSLGIHANWWPSGGIHVYWLHVLNGGDRVGILVWRRDKNGVWLEKRCVCDTRPSVPLLPLLAMAPGTVGTPPRKIIRTPRLPQFVVGNYGVVFENGVTKSKNRFELFLGCSGVLQLRLDRAHNSWHARMEGELIVGCRRRVATTDSDKTTVGDV